MSGENVAKKPSVYVNICPECGKPMDEFEVTRSVTGLCKTCERELFFDTTEETEK